jgi:hypothetical protein
MTRGGILVAQAFQCGLHRGQIGKRMHAFAALADFATGLWAAQHQGGQRRLFRRGDRIAQAQQMFVFGDARAGLIALRHETTLDQRRERGAHLFVTERHHRVASGELVAARDDGVE